ncbi:MAG: efflux RND transporter permease subunit [Chlamydiales bacterium]|nr:efflux RND transporter permease subunit [Chlamydiales bacterium]
MNFSELSIKNPIFTIVCSLMITLLGVLALIKLPLKEFPSFESPSINIQTAYPGANPKLVEKKITTPIEKTLLEIPGIDFIESYSSLSVSNIEVNFKSGENVKHIVSEVRSKLNEVENHLPKEAKKPTIHQSKESSRPNIFIGVTSDKIASDDIFQFTTQNLVSAFKQIPGVSIIKVSGTKKIASIKINPNISQSLGITISDITKALEKYQDLPGGIQETGNSSISNVLKGKIDSIEKLKEVILLSGKGGYVKLKDIADISYEKDTKSLPSKINGKNSTIIRIHKEETANPLTISSLAREKVAELQKSMPRDMAIEIVYDNARFIKNSLKELRNTVIEAALLVIAIIFIFLKSFRATLVALVTIPISLLGAFFCLYLMGYSINTMTLLALVLAIGIVVDDAIVVLENIYRYIEKGFSPLEAAIKGTKEITFSVIAMTLTLACVFFPLLFIKGFVGSLFVEFGMALSCAILISGYVALSISAMLSAYILKDKDFSHIESKTTFYQTFYSSILRKSLSYKYLVLLVSALLFLPAYYLYQETPKKLAPQEDRGVIFLGAYTPGNPSKETMSSSLNYIESIAKKTPESAGYISDVWNSFAQVTLLLNPWNQRERSASEIIKSMKNDLENYPSSWCFANTPSGLIESEGSESISAVFTTPYDTKALQQMTDIARKEIKKYPGLTNFMSFLKKDVLENHFQVDHEKLNKYQVSPSSLSDELQALFKGINHLKLTTNQKQFAIKLLYETDYLNIEHALSQTFVKGVSDGKAALIPLSQLVHLSPKFSQQDFIHYNGSLATFVKADLSEGYTLEDAASFFEHLAKDKFPPFSQVQFSGAMKKFYETNKEITFIFIFACLAIYLVLAAQFESFIDPFIILLTVPLAVLGSLASLKLCGSSLNFYSQIGIITLIGIITKHGILIVDFANKQLEKGYTAFEATVSAASLRLRPILMTTLSTIFGAIPLVISNDAGKELRFEIGLSLIGGLLLGTLLTLLVIPNFYLLLSFFKKNPKHTSEQL